MSNFASVKFRSKPSLVDQAVHLPQLARNTFTVVGGVFDIPTFENADTFVTRLMRSELLTMDQVVEDDLRGQALNSSLRSVQRRFSPANGLSYQKTRQIERAGKALTLLRDGMSFLDVVHEAGCFDQPHLTRSFKLYSELSPTQAAHAGQWISAGQ